MIQLILATLMTGYAFAMPSDFPTQVIEVICRAKTLNKENVKIIAYGNIEDESKLILVKGETSSPESWYTAKRQNEYAEMGIMGTKRYVGIQYISENEKLEFSVQNDGFHKFQLNGVEKYKSLTCEKFFSVILN